MFSEIEMIRWEGECSQARPDRVALEEPLEISVNGTVIAVTMRTPDSDFALCAGFLLAEGFVAKPGDIRFMGYVGTAANSVNATLRTVDDHLLAERQRPFTIGSSCGVCGKSGLDAVRCNAAPIPEDNWTVHACTLRGLSGTMRGAQRTFEHTGGLHAAALFDDSGALLAMHEDVGRHNAVDKVIGSRLLAHALPAARTILMVSGRTSFEIVQKAAVAGIPVVCAVSAPSSYAVSLAAAMNITLTGFMRGETMNVYTHPDRVVP
jgi:FdhD protein